MYCFTNWGRYWDFCRWQSPNYWSLGRFSRISIEWSQGDSSYCRWDRCVIDNPNYHWIINRSINRSVSQSVRPPVLWVIQSISRSVSRSVGQSVSRSVGQSVVSFCGICLRLLLKLYLKITDYQVVVLPSLRDCGLHMHVLFQGSVYSFEWKRDVVSGRKRITRN